MLWEPHSLLSDRTTAVKEVCHGYRFNIFVPDREVSWPECKFKVK